jgi:hypothetical protein
VAGWSNTKTFAKFYRKKTKETSSSVSQNVVLNSFLQSFLKAAVCFKYSFKTKVTHNLLSGGYAKRSIPFCDQLGLFCFNNPSKNIVYE